MKSDAVFFLGVLVFFFAAWLYSGGPNRPISFAGPYITPITDVDTNQQGYGDGGSFWGDITNIGNGLTGLQGTNDPSPLRGEVRVSGVNNAGTTDLDLEYVTIQNTGTAPIDITGWRLVSGASGKSGRIPEGAALPRSGRVNPTDRIVLQPGDTALVVTGESPLGVSFKENRCIGYLSRNQKYQPALPLTCPLASEEFAQHYTGNELRDDTCYYRMQSTPSCTTPSRSGVSSRCEDLIDEYLTYNGCVEHHRSDANFVGNTWRIYLDENRELWKPTRDSVKLLDASGKTVDLYTY